MEVCTTREINLDSCRFNKPFNDQNGITRSKLSHNGNTSELVIQTPKFNLRESNDDFIELLISRNKELHREFYHVISHLEDAAITQIVQNSGSWFKQNWSKSQIENSFRSSLNRPLDIDSPFILRIPKIKKLEIETNFPVICLIKINGIIFGQTSSKLDMTVIKVKIVKQELKLKPINDDTNMSVRSNMYNDSVSIAPSLYKPSETFVDDSNNDNELDSFIPSDQTKELEDTYSSQMKSEIEPIIPALTQEEIEMKVLRASSIGDIEELENLKRLYYSN